MIQITGVLFVLYGIGIAAGIGNNIGRIGAILTPIIIVFTIIHLTTIEALIGGKTTE